MSSTPLCLLLLPAALEDFPRAEEVHDLLRAPSVVAVEPARLARAPEALSGLQAHRLLRKLEGTPRVVVLYDAAQEALARQVAARCPDCEVVDAPAGSEGPAFKRNAPLWDRLEELGVARR